MQAMEVEKSSRSRVRGWIPLGSRRKGLRILGNRDVRVVAAGD